MTLELQAALPEELAQKIAETAALRGLPEWDFMVLLVGISTQPQMRLSEDPVVRDLSDEMMLFCQRRAAGLERESGKMLNLLPDPFAIERNRETLLVELRNHRISQALDELKRRVQPPPGKTIRDMLSAEPWPGEETDEELLAALKAMD